MHSAFVKSTVLALFLVLSTFAASTAQAAKGYPRRVITVIVPYLPGGFIEIITRPYVEAMSRELGVPMVINPMPGAAGVIGITKALQAKPDGYTLFVASDSAFIYHPLIRKVRYTRADANPIYGVHQPAGLLATSKSQTKFSTFEGMIEYAKAHPGEITLGVTGLNSIFQTMLTQMEKAYGIDVQPVPFDGAVAITNAIASNHIDAGFTEHTQNSELQPLLAYSGKNDFFPGLADFGDFGHPEINSGFKVILFGQAKLPEDIRQQLKAAAMKASQDPAFLKLAHTMANSSYPVAETEILKEFDTAIVLVKQLIAEGVLIPEQ